MSKTEKPPRLLFRKARPEKRIPGSWVIAHRGKERRLGLREEERAEAERRLFDYQAEVYNPPKRSEDLTVAQIIDKYRREHLPHTLGVKNGTSVLGVLEAGLGHFHASELTNDDLKRWATKNHYLDSTTRGHVLYLQAAFSHAGYDTKFWRPERPDSRSRYLSQNEICRMLMAASSRRRRHFQRMILLGIYTGTRSTALRKLEWGPNKNGGHIDADTGLLYRKSDYARKTNKRQPVFQLTPKMHGHVKRWRRMDRGGPGFKIISFMNSGKQLNAPHNTWERICADAGVADATIHDMRRTAITNAVRGGVETLDISAAFGIGVEELALTYFVHDPRRQEKIARALDRRG